MQMDNKGWNEFDLSTLTFPQFVALCFDRPVLADSKEFQLFHSGINAFVASDPNIVVTHVRTMCREFATLAPAYSKEQIDQGLWAVFGAGIGCDQFIFDPSVDNTLRLECIESMYIPFAEVVTHCSTDIRATFYWMWWDIILHTFWSIADNYRRDYSALSNDWKRVVDTMHITLSRILGLDHHGCQVCALHGFGHLHHPSVGEIVQRYIEVHRHEINQDELHWVEQCRDGSVQ
jgi:hypothetical protein